MDLEALSKNASTVRDFPNVKITSFGWMCFKASSAILSELTLTKKLFLKILIYYCKQHQHIITYLVSSSEISSLIAVWTSNLISGISSV